MKLKDYFNNIFGTDGQLDNHYSKDDKAIIANYKQLLQQKIDQIKLIEAQNYEKTLKLNQDLTFSQNQVLSLTQDNLFLKQKLDTKYDIPEEFFNLRLLYDKKYPYSDIYYKGRPIRYLDKGIEKEYTPDVHVPNFIYDFVALRTFLVERGLTWSEYYNKHKSFKIAMDKLHEDIYIEFIKLINYRFDKELFGNEEFWSGPWMTFYLKIKNERFADCEDSSFLLMALFKASGMPRGFQRAVCGDTHSGFGHCTVHVYNFEQDKWFHYEATAKTKMIFAAKDKNGIGLKNVWFSFDWEYSWSTEPANLVQEKINTIRNS